jgi:N-acetylglucosamine-6-phosphate deacetylase
MSILLSFVPPSPQKNRNNLALVSDAMPTVGTDRDHFELMGRQIHLRCGRLVSENGTLAGAHLSLASAIKNAVTFGGIVLDEALRAASLVPARFWESKDIAVR